MLLVGLPPLSLAAFEAPMREVADVLVVPFPGAQFDQAVEATPFDLVVVDVTYLDQSVVRPLIGRRLHGRTTVAYLSPTGGAWLDDLRTGATSLVSEPVVPRLVAMAAGSAAHERAAG
ncbi:MAG: hypothetical protein ACTHNU_08410 [Gaiellales bacterium]